MEGSEELVSASGPEHGGCWVLGLPGPTSVPTQSCAGRAFWDVGRVMSASLNEPNEDDLNLWFDLQSLFRKGEINPH